MWATCYIFKNLTDVVSTERASIFAGYTQFLTRGVEYTFRDRSVIVDSYSSRGYLSFTDFVTDTGFLGRFEYTTSSFLPYSTFYGAVTVSEYPTDSITEMYESPRYRAFGIRHIRRGFPSVSIQLQAAENLYNYLLEHATQYPDYDSWYEAAMAL